MNPIDLSTDELLDLIRMSLDYCLYLVKTVNIENKEEVVWSYLEIVETTLQVKNLLEVYNERDDRELCS